MNEKLKTDLMNAILKTENEWTHKYKSYTTASLLMHVFEVFDWNTRPAPDMTEAIVETVIELNLKCFWSGDRTWIDDYKKELGAALTDLQEKPYYCHCDQPDFHHNDTTSCKRCGRPFDLRVD